jgi:hypothetical protein
LHGDKAFGNVVIVDHTVMDLSVVEKHSKLRISICGRKLYSVCFACAYQNFKI